MQKLWLCPLLLFIALRLDAQFEEWSDPVALTDSSSYNMNPAVINFETETYMFYEKKMSPDGPSMIWFRDIKNMEEEVALLTGEDQSYRNPVIAMWTYYENYYWLFYESNPEGNFDIFALPFDEFMNFGTPIQVTSTPEDENNMSLVSYYEIISWERAGNIIAAELIMDTDTVFVQNQHTIDSGYCSGPSCCNLSVVYRKWASDSAAVYVSSYSYVSGWGDPIAVDTLGNNSHCHCSAVFWDYYWDESIVYEKEGDIFVYYDDEQFPFELPEIAGGMHQPHSAFYDLPVENLPLPLFMTFITSGETENDVYAYWNGWGWGTPATNLSGDTLMNQNPGFHWGWYANAPCSQYFLDIWETEKNGYQTLYMSKTPLYVCGSVSETGQAENELEIFPNPFNENLVIRYNAHNNKPIDIEIMDMEGQRIGEMTLDNAVSGWNETVFSPPPELPPGPLFMMVKQGEKQLFRKVIYK